MYHFSESEYRHLMAKIAREERRDMLLFALCLLAVFALMADLWIRGVDSLFGRAFIWLVTTAA